MRAKSPELMRKICDFSERYILENGSSPSTTAIAEELGIARGTAYKYLAEMRDRGMIEYDGETITTSGVKRMERASSRAAIVGVIPCGPLEEETENIEAYVNLPDAIFGRGDFYILRASGDSMINAGIDDGDLVVIERRPEARDGDIVAALVENESTLKRYIPDRAGGRVILRPENDEMEDIIVPSCEIQGVARHVIKHL